MRPMRWVTAALLLATLASPAPARMLQVGETAVPFLLLDSSGQRVSLNDSIGEKPVLVMFSSVGCQPCQESTPALEAVRARYGDQVEILCVMVSDPAAVERLLASGGANLAARLLLDQQQEGTFTTAAAYGVLGTPTTFLVDCDGTIAWRHVGRLTSESVDAALAMVLGG